MPLKIDYDRGVQKRHHGSGLEIYMYVDAPGVYLNSHGTEVSEALAQQAGYPTEDLGRQRVMKERMAQATEAIAREMGIAPKEKKVVKEKGGFKVIDIGIGRHQIEDPDGAVLTPQPLPLEQATRLLEELVPTQK